MQDLRSGAGPGENRGQTPKKPGSDPKPRSDSKPGSAPEHVPDPAVGRIAALRFATNRRCAALLARVIAWLDRNADRQGEEWGARMEYTRRYTNPDEAVRAREPLPDRRKGERRS